MRSAHANQDEHHVPVLVGPVIEYLAPSPGKKILDATLGYAGHSVRLAEKLIPGGTLICLDRDAEALQAANARLEPYRAYLTIITQHCAFGNISQVLKELGAGIPPKMDGFLFDLGVSSAQLESAPGFSFRRDDYLDGRMNRSGDEPTVADIIESSSEQELSRIFWDYGDERYARRIARGITDFKATGSKLLTTGQLVKIVENAVPRAAWPRDINVSTKVFQALRIRCNGEMEQLQAGLDGAIDNLAPKGRIVVISYHSLEDRIVKNTFARRAGKEPSASGYSPAALAPNLNRESADLVLITRKPVVADDQELQANIRARSAKLRCAERIG